MMQQFHRVGMVTTAVKEEYDKAHINWWYWQIGYEESYTIVDVPYHDILFIGNAYSNDRLDLGDMLMSLDYDTGLYGIWPKSYNSRGQNLYKFSSGAHLYANAKISIGDSQWTDATGFVSNRLFQALAAGAFLLHQEFDGMEELLGLKDGVHLVTWTDLHDLNSKINYWINRKKERYTIALAGQNYVTMHHSFDARVKELWDVVNFST